MAATPGDEPRTPSYQSPPRNGSRARKTGYGPLTRTRAIWRKRSVIGLLVRRDLKVRYSSSVLGYFWTILDPLLMALIYWFVFTLIFDRGIGREPYVLFLLAGMLPFHWFQHSVNGAAGAIKGERLVRSTALPREIWILRVVFSKGAEYLFALPVVAIFVLAYWHPVNVKILLMIPALLLEAILITGAMLLLSPLGALFRDVDRVVRIAMRFMFYATPVLYGVHDVVGNDALPKIIRDVYALNPMMGIVSMFRAGLFPGELDWSAVGMAVAGTFVIFAAGWWVFARLESAVLKEI